MTKQSNDEPTPRVVPLAPHLTVNGATQAIEFYARAFGARAGYVQKTPEGRVMHADLALPNGGVFFLNDDFSEHGGSRAPADARSPVTIHLELNDVDAVWEKAIAAGAIVEMPLADQFWGDRSGSITDPFGHNWMIATHIEDPSADEVRSRVKTMFESGAPC